MCSDRHLKPLRIETASKQSGQPVHCHKGCSGTDSYPNLFVEHFLLFFDAVDFDATTTECSLRVAQ
jgi:hypothetical protein